MPPGRLAVEPQPRPAVQRPRRQGRPPDAPARRLAADGGGGGEGPGGGVVAAASEHRKAAKRTTDALRYWKRKAEKFQKLYLDKKQELLDMQDRASYVIRNPKRKRTSTEHRVSPHGGYSLAMKRNLGHGGSEALTSSLEASVQRYSVDRWEVQLAIAGLVLSRDWCFM